MSTERLTEMHRALNEKRVLLAPNEQAKLSIVRDRIGIMTDAELEKYETYIRAIMDVVAIEREVRQ